MSGVQISRPDRWNIPFSDEMTGEHVARLLALPLFSENAIDPRKFTQKIPLAGILQNDARLIECTNGEIIVHKGDWGNSAFFLLSGAVRVEIERIRKMPAEMLSRSTIRRKSFLETLRQFWRSPRDSEVRDLSADQRDSTSAGNRRGSETRVFLQDFSHVIDRDKTTRIEAVEIFGEQSALGRIERTATVFADGDCELLEMRWQGIRDIMKCAPWLRQRIDERFRTHGLRAFLRNSPYFAHLDIDESLPSDKQKHHSGLFRKLCEQAQFTSYGSYDRVDRFTRLVEAGQSSNLAHEPVIAHEGNRPRGVILVRSGIARVSHKYNNGHKTVSYLVPGQAFGVDEIVKGWRDGAPEHLKHSLRAVGYVTVVVIPAAVFEEVVLNELLPKNGNSGRSPLFASRREDTSPRMDAGLMEFLVERRFVNGTAAMVIDLDRCTRCDDCVRACAASHDNNPRFLRHGPIHGKYMVANACMHCADPVCMVQCPTGAIHRDVIEGQVLINDRTCVGCSACMHNCPYDAIRMVTIRDDEGNPVYPTHVSRKSETGEDLTLPVLPTMKEWEPIEKATKCDLCADQTTGPACQNACPHDALVRLNLGNYETATEWLAR